jgi:hypothetical protein
LHTDHPALEVLSTLIYPCGPAVRVKPDRDQFPAAVRQTAGPAEARAKAIAMDYETEPLSKLARNCDFGGSTHRPGDLPLSQRRRRSRCSSVSGTLTNSATERELSKRTTEGRKDCRRHSPRVSRRGCQRNDTIHPGAANLRRKVEDETSHRQTCSVGVAPRTRGRTAIARSSRVR